MEELEKAKRGTQVIFASVGLDGMSSNKEGWGALVETFGDLAVEGGYAHEFSTSSRHSVDPEEESPAYKDFPKLLVEEGEDLFGGGHYEYPSEPSCAYEMSAQNAATARSEASTAAACNTTPATSSAAPSTGVVENTEFKRWKQGDPQTYEYFYDEEIPHRAIIKTDLADLPPLVNLSDAWISVVLSAGFTPKERGDKWPMVFSSNI